MNIYKILLKQIRAIVKQQFELDDAVLKKIIIEIPKDVNEGDVSTNAAFVVSKYLKEK